MATSITNTSITTDDLTIDTNTLKVDSTNNHVGFGTARPQAPIDATLAAGNDWVARFQNTTSATPYNVQIYDAASAANGYPLLQVTNSAGSGTYFRVDSGTGIVTKPYQPAFHIQGTGPAHTGSQETAIYYVSTPTIKFNVGNHGVGGTDSATSGKFTCPASGMYLVCCTWYRGGSATAYMGTIVKKNGASYYSYFYNNASNYGDASVGQTAMIQCSANDVLQQYVYGNSSDSDPGTTMQIYFLG